MKVFFLILCIISHIAYARDSGDASWTKVSLIIYQIHTFLPLTIIHTFCENVFLQAVSHYVSDLSWRRFLLNLINPSLNDIVDETNQRTLQHSELMLDSEANWTTAVLKTLSRQDTFNNIVSEALKAVTRIIGWSALMLVRIGRILKNYIIFLLNSSRDCIHFEMI